MKRHQLIRNLSNLCEKYIANSPYLLLSEYLLWFFELETRESDFVYTDELFAKQIMIAMALLSTSKIDDIVISRDKILLISSGYGFKEIPDLTNITVDKHTYRQKKAFELLLKNVVCDLFAGFEFTFWPAIASKILTPENQLSNAIVSFMANVWENGFYYIATENPQQKVIKVGDIPISVSIDEGQVSLSFSEGKIQIFLIENEIYAFPDFSHFDIGLVEALSVIDQIVKTWIASQSDHSLVQVII